MVTKADLPKVGDTLRLLPNDDEVPKVYQNVILTVTSVERIYGHWAIYTSLEVKGRRDSWMCYASQEGKVWERDDFEKHERFI